MTTHCTACDLPLGPEAMACDEALDGVWHPDCFDETACGKGEHGEGCATLILADEDIDLGGDPGGLAGDV